MSVSAFAAPLSEGHHTHLQSQSQGHMWEMPESLARAGVVWGWTEKQSLIIILWDIINFVFFLPFSLYVHLSVCICTYAYVCVSITYYIYIHMNQKEVIQALLSKYLFMKILKPILKTKRKMKKKIPVLQVHKCLQVLRSGDQAKHRPFDSPWVCTSVLLQE